MLGILLPDRLACACVRPWMILGNGHVMQYVSGAWRGCAPSQGRHELGLYVAASQVNAFALPASAPAPLAPQRRVRPRGGLLVPAGARAAGHAAKRRGRAPRRRAQDSVLGHAPALLPPDAHGHQGARRACMHARTGRRRGGGACIHACMHARMLAYMPAPDDGRLEGSAACVMHALILWQLHR